MITFLRFKLFLIFFLLSESYASELDAQRLVFKSENADAEYRLTLSALKTVNARLVAEREALVSGRLERFTYEFISDLKYHEAWALLESELRVAEYRELFSCDGLSCGSSNAWANNRFGIKQLYGLDQTQKYRAFVRDYQDGVEYFVLYFVQRGSKRNYAQVDRIFSKNRVDDITESPTTILRLLEQVGSYSVRLNDESDIPEQQLDLLIEALKIKPISRFYLVGHCAKSRKHEENLTCGQAFSESVKAQLLERGIQERRLLVKSVGDLAPADKLPSSRVELVLIGARL